MSLPGAAQTGTFDLDRRSDVLTRVWRLRLGRHADRRPRRPTYARLQFGVGPGGAFEIPVEVDYGVEFAGSDWSAWQAEYAACVFEAGVFRYVPPPLLSGEYRRTRPGRSTKRGWVTRACGEFPSTWDEEASHDEF